MRGAKPKLKNVIPMRGDQDAAAVLRAQNVRKAVRAFCPRGLDRELRREWNRVGHILAEPTVDRLKARYVDVILEYCRVMVRLRKLRSAFEAMVVADDASAETVGPRDAIEAEIHRTEGRHGEQLKSHPHVAQINEAWRQWRALVAMLGLSPTDERNLIPGQGDMFDESEQYFS